MVDKSDILALMDKSEAVFLATISENGPRIRALVNLRRDDLYPGSSRTARSHDGTVYLATSGASDKVRDIRTNPAVSVYFCVPRQFHGVSVSGHAEILNDPALKEALWSDDWRIYWPDGATNPDYVVIRIAPEEIRGWWESRPFKLEAA